jgi:hypothetical protein
MTGNEIAKVAVFDGKHIRKILHEGEWWFSVVDIVQVLTGSSIPKRYWRDLKKKLVSEGFTETYEKIVQLKFAADAGGKLSVQDYRRRVEKAVYQPLIFSMYLSNIKPLISLILRRTRTSSRSLRKTVRRYSA